jgi:hypothetical protein
LLAPTNYPSVFRSRLLLGLALCDGFLSGDFLGSYFYDGFLYYGFGYYFLSDGGFLGYGFRSCLYYRFGYYFFNDWFRDSQVSAVVGMSVLCRLLGESFFWSKFTHLIYRPC